MIPQDAVAGDLLPPLTDDDLRRVLGIGWTTFYRMKKLGRFDALVVTPSYTPTVRYSRRLVQAWLDGQAVSHARSFGRRRA